MAILLKDYATFSLHAVPFADAEVTSGSVVIKQQVCWLRSAVSERFCPLWQKKSCFGFSQLKVTASDKPLLKGCNSVFVCMLNKNHSYWSKKQAIMPTPANTAQHHSTVAKLTIYLSHCCWIKYYKSSSEVPNKTCCMSDALLVLYLLQWSWMFILNMDKVFNNEVRVLYCNLRKQLWTLSFTQVFLSLMCMMS